MTLPTQPGNASSVLLRRSLAAAVIGGGLCALGAIANADQFLRAYLVAWVFWTGISLGSLAVLMLHRLTGGSWGEALVRHAERAAALLPGMGLLFLPVLAELPRLYPWARSDVVEHDELLQAKLPYLNPTAFTGRAIAFFVLWSLLALLMRSNRRWRLPGNVAGFGLGVYVLTGTFAGIDWGMSLEPHWYSTTYGVMFVVGMGLSGLAFSTVAVTKLSDQRPWPADLPKAALRDLNNLLLAFTMLWAYIAFTQFLIIWYGNLAEDAVWFQHRLEGGWEVIALALVGFHFAVPFLALLNGAGKHNPRALGSIAAGLLVAHWFDIHWLIMPAFSPGKLSFSWLDPVAAVTVGGLWLAGWSLQGGSQESNPMSAV
jgi:hypothetical protein